MRFPRVPHFPRFPRLGCLGWVAIFFGGLVVIALGLRLWCWSDGDLRQVEAEARALGIPPTWDEAGLGQGNPQAKVRFEELHRLVERLPRWAGNQGSLYRIGEPLPPKFIELQASIQSNDWADVVECIQQLTGQSVVPYSTPQEAARIPQWSDSEGRFPQFLAHRFLVAPAAELPGLMTKFTQVMNAEQVQGIRTSGIQIESFMRLLRAVAFRAPEIHGTETAADIASQLADIRDLRWKNRTHSLIAELPQVCWYPERRMAEHFRSTKSGWHGEWEATQRTAIFFMVHLIVRHQRASVMRHVVACIHSVQQASNPSDMMRRVRAFTAPQVLMMNFGGYDSKRRFAREVEVLLTCDVLISGLQGSPVPIDYFDPAEGPLHSVERAGKRIGWYSVGSNGIDEGGLRGGSSSGDFAIPTAGVFGEPHFADEPKVVSPPGMMPPGKL